MMNVTLMHKILVIILYFLLIVPTYVQSSNQFMFTPDGVRIIGLSNQCRLEMNANGSPLFFFPKGEIYTLQKNGILNKFLEINDVMGYKFSPNHSRIMLIRNNDPNRFSVFDLNTRKYILNGDGKYDFLSFIDKNRFILYKEKWAENALLYDLETNTRLNVSCENIIQIIDIQPDKNCLIGIYGEKYEPQNNKYITYQINEVYLHRWNYLSNEVYDHILLENSKQYVGGNSMGYQEELDINFLTPNFNSNEMIGVEYWLGEHLYQGYRFRVWDIESGNEITNISIDIGGYFDTEYKISPNRQWLLVDNFPFGLVDISNIQNTGLNFISGNKAQIKDIAFDNERMLYTFGRVGDEPLDGVFGLHTYDIIDKEYSDIYCLLEGPLSSTEADFFHSNKLITNPRIYFDAEWDFENKAVERISFPYQLSEAFNYNIDISPNDSLIVGVMLHDAFIVDASSYIFLQTVNISDNDNKNYVRFNHTGSQFLTASGNQDAPGVDNLIRIWDAETFEMLREIRGHSDSVWYAEFSPDDGRIVSASLDGSAKVWDAQSGEQVAEFVGHATGVEYAAFFPDGRRVLSAGRDRCAYVWDAETAQVERTFENIHLPAQLSPEGKLLFAGSEVWDVETGECIRILDGVAQDYSCLTLSPDGTLLLSSEYEGFTKVWNVQEHILEPAGVWDYSVHECD